ncbi:MAG: efflux RND transporter periplasmic adaptor subunit [Alphaproteobacteria bacterium]|nr:efflux RND transporter periplasmic adaptor subunit [Alphaproteobacteria bacterium]
MPPALRKGLYGAIALVVVLAVWWSMGGPALFSTPQPASSSAAPPSNGLASKPPGSPGKDGGGAAGGGKPVTVEAQTVTQADFLHEISAVGSLLSNESVMIRPEIAGKVAKILFEEGTSVRKGQLLVKLDDSTFGADVKQAHANLDLSKANFERATKLYSQGAGTARALDEADSKLKVDQSRLEVARNNLAKTEITAPFEGVVGLRKVSTGAYVIPGQDLVNLEGIDPIKADFQVPESALSVIKPGMPLIVHADSYPGQAFSGEVYAIDPKIDPVNRSVAARARLPNEKGLLKPGMFVRIGLVTRKTENALLVPEESLIPRGSQMFVYKVVDGKVASQMIKTGARRQGQVEVIEGLKQGDLVITAGHMKVKEGGPVLIAGQAPPASAPAKP